MSYRYFTSTSRARLLKVCIADAKKNDWNGLHWDLMEKVIPFLESQLQSERKKVERLSKTARERRGFGVAADAA